MEGNEKLTQAEECQYHVDTLGESNLALLPSRWTWELGRLGCLLLSKRHANPRAPKADADQQGRIPTKEQGYQLPQLEIGSATCEQNNETKEKIPNEKNVTLQHGRLLQHFLLGTR